MLLRSPSCQAATLPAGPGSKGLGEGVVAGRALLHRQDGTAAVGVDDRDVEPRTVLEQLHVALHVGVDGGKRRKDYAGASELVSFGALSSADAPDAFGRGCDDSDFSCCLSGKAQSYRATEWLKPSSARDQRDYVRVSPRPKAESVMRRLPSWIAHYNQVHPAQGSRLSFTP
jgi:hypothetical protein